MIFDFNMAWQQKVQFEITEGKFTSRKNLYYFPDFDFLLFTTSSFWFNFFVKPTMQFIKQPSFKLHDKE